MKPAFLIVVLTLPLCAQQDARLAWAPVPAQPATWVAPGAKTPRRFHPDTRAWWIVQDGQIRFIIEGQDPFVASKGYLVQVPYRTLYSLETVGDKPSLRLEVNIAGAQTMYPADETPVPLDGVNFVKVRIPVGGCQQRSFPRGIARILVYSAGENGV